MNDKGKPRSSNRIFYCNARDRRLGIPRKSHLFGGTLNFARLIPLFRLSAPAALLALALALK